MASSEMKSSSPVFEKTYQTVDEFRKDFDQNLSNGAAMVTSLDEVELRSIGSVRLKLGSTVLAEIKAEAVYVTPGTSGYSVGLELKDDFLDPLEKRLEELENSEDDDEKWGRDSESIQHRIAAMSMQEKIQTAIRGNRQERRILMKDTYLNVHKFLLKNPKLTKEEVSRFAAQASITGEMINTISSNQEWMQDRKIRLSVIKNPKTPSVIIQKYMGKLNDTELLQLAKSDNVRANVSTMAKRVLASRGKRIS